jgi:hypothetical protein
MATHSHERKDPEKPPAPRSNEPRFAEQDLVYDPDEFIIRSQDAKGHDVRETVRIQPGMERAIEELLQCKLWPYKTRSDLLRHAIYRHIRWLQRLAPELPRQFLVALNITQRMAADEVHRREMEVTLIQLEEQIVHYLNQGDSGEAIRLAAMARSEMDKVPDCLWRRRYMEQFNQRFGGLLSPDLKAPLLIEGQTSEQPAKPPAVLEAEFVEEEE